MTPALEKSLESFPLHKEMLMNKKLFIGAGCEACGQTGYVGRLCINEVLVADASIREAILNKVSSGELKQLAIKNGMTTMLEDGFAKAFAGVTTIEEVLRVIHE